MFIYSSTTFLGGGESFSWVKWASIAKLWDMIMSGREIFSLKMEEFQAIQIPQRMRRGSALIFLFLWSYNQDLHASSMVGPF